MARIIFTPARQAVLRALTRVLGSRNFIIVATLCIGIVLFLWARYELGRTFASVETGEIVVRVGEAAAGCKAPSLYLLPLETPGAYLGVVDFLGGGIADRSILNIGRASIALSYDGGENARATEAPRADAAACTSMTVDITGGISRIVPLTESDQALANVAPSSAVTMKTSEGGATFVFTGSQDESKARTAFRIEGVRDAWQYAYRRLNLWNAGRGPVDVFLLAAPDTVFMSDSMEPIKAPLRNRSVAAIHLAAPGALAGNGYQVYSRFLDYDARLQSRLITVSTFFGIGISLMVEGLVLVLLRVAKRFRGSAASADDRDEER